MSILASLPRLSSGRANNPFAADIDFGTLKQQAQQRLADLGDPALIDAPSTAEWHAERRGAEKIRAMKRDAQFNEAEDAHHHEKRRRHIALADAEAHARAAAEQHRLISPAVRIGRLYRGSRSTTHILGSVLSAGVVWGAVNVQHNMMAGGFGHHSLTSWCDNTGESLALMPRPGNAGSNTAADHIKVIDASIAATPYRFRRHLRPDADVAELTGLLRHSTGGDRLEGWPEDMRILVRREKIQSGTQLSLFEQHNGYRYQPFATNTEGSVPPRLEARHRVHARVEGFIRCAKATGFAKWPSQSASINSAWLTAVAIAVDLPAWTQAIA